MITLPTWLQRKKGLPENFNPGESIFSWTAHDYHPHRRGLLWMILFCLILMGGGIWALFFSQTLGWSTALSFFVAASVYFYIHRKGNEDHEVEIFKNGLMIDQSQYIPWQAIRGYWFIYDETGAVIHFEKQRNEKIPLQMGQQKPETFRAILKSVGLEELENKQESLIDLWIRALKL
jgi:hypothetical protein